MTQMSAWYWGRPEIEQPLLEQMPLHKSATEDDIAGDRVPAQRRRSHDQRRQPTHRRRLHQPPKGLATTDS
jgi:hypothetical protein